MQISNACSGCNFLYLNSAHEDTVSTFFYRANLLKIQSNLLKISLLLLIYSVFCHIFYSELPRFILGLILTAVWGPKMLKNPSRMHLTVAV